MNTYKTVCKIVFLFFLLTVWTTPSWCSDTTAGCGAPSRSSIYKNDLPVQPKVRPAFTPLPIGQVRPSGWLGDWAKDARNGLTGHLDERSATFKNAWKGFHFEAVGVEPNGTGWPLEQCSYWLDGLVRLAFILDDPYLIDKATSRLDIVVDGVLNGGDSFIFWLDKSILDNAFNSWAHSHMGRALVAYYQATGNPRVLETLQRVYRDFPLADIAPGFGPVNLDAMLDTYAMSGDEQILDNAISFAGRKSFEDLIDYWLKDEIPSDHTVIFYENARVPALLYPWTGDKYMLRATQHYLELSDQYHELPMGVCSGEEFLAGIGSTRHIEACDVTAAQWTFSWLLRITGDRRYADRIEQIFFNAFPPTVDQDFDKMSYFQAPNRVETILPGEIAFGGGYRYSSLGGGALCCPGNVNRILPNYVMLMWMATPDNGLAATLYGPCRVTTTVANNVPVTIDCQTAYPFEETVRMIVQPKTATAFPLYLRLPAWSEKPVITVNDKTIAIQPGPDGFVKLDRLWNPADRVILQFPMAVRVKQGRETPFPQIDYFKQETVYKRASAQLTDVNNPYACVYYGPLLFALPLPEKNPNQQVDGAAFNFALEADRAKLADEIKVSHTTMPTYWKWRWDMAPIQLQVPARQFDWSPTALQPLPKEPVEGGTPAGIMLVPYGCTKFHISMFPVAKPSTENTPSPLKQNQDSVRVLENNCLSLTINEQTGLMIRLDNKLTGESYRINDDGFCFDAVGWNVDFSDVKLISLTQQPGRITARYEHPKVNIEVGYVLGQEQHFAEKQMQITFKGACGLKQVTLCRPTFSSDNLQMLCYRYPDFEIVRAMVKVRHGWDFQRPPDSEPDRTFFGQTPKGGFFTGVAMPYDASKLKDSRVTLAYAPSLKIKAGQILDGETVYLGVYRSGKSDASSNNAAVSIQNLCLANHNTSELEADAIGLNEQTSSDRKVSSDIFSKTYPSPAQSQAMTVMTSAILGPPRHRLMAFDCGWHSQMQQDGYDNNGELEGDLKSLEFFKECGLDGVTESQPWGGQTDKMNTLRERECFEINAQNRKLLDHAKQLGLTVMQWSTITNTHPWNKRGRPFRLDQPQWLRGVKGKPSLLPHVGEFRQQFANCLGCRSYTDWLKQRIVDVLATGQYNGWGIDGDFWGTGAFFHTTVPVTCQADYHDHLAGDSNYACQKAMEYLVSTIRHYHTDFYLMAFRPTMDLGVWALRNYDACFTLIESGTGNDNIAAGDEIRTASRIRIHHHFFPHWLDQSLLFPSYSDSTLKNVPPWSNENIDYIMLSALSCSPNLLLYLPTKTGIPQKDKQEIKKWLDWGRDNSRYLMVRKDLPDWPEHGKIDGSAHIIDDRGLVFLFNPGPDVLPCEFAFTEESIGLTISGEYTIIQEYPPSDDLRMAQYGDSVRWVVPSQGAVVLRIQK